MSEEGAESFELYLDKKNARVARNIIEVVLTAFVDEAAMFRGGSKAEPTLRTVKAKLKRTAKAGGTIHLSRKDVCYLWMSVDLAQLACAEPAPHKSSKVRRLATVVNELDLGPVKNYRISSDGASH